MKYTEDFETFWLKYPARYSRTMNTRIKRKKKPAFIAWQKLSEEIKKECLSKVSLIKRAEGDASSVRDCVTWLNQCGWDEIQLPKEPRLDKEFTEKILKEAPEDKINVNDRRNLLRKGLGL